MLIKITRLKTLLKQRIRLTNKVIIQLSLVLVQQNKLADEHSFYFSNICSLIEQGNELNRVLESLMSRNIKRLYHFRHKPYLMFRGSFKCICWLSSH